MPVVALVALFAACPGCCSSAIKLGEYGTDFVRFVWLDYARYIRKWEKNLVSLHENLYAMCVKKAYIIRKVEEGKFKKERTTLKTEKWFKDVSKLLEKKELKYILSTKVETAKIAVKMTEDKDLKRRLCKETWMQKVVVDVMKKLKEEMGNSIGDQNLVQVDYKNVAEVLKEIVLDVVEDLKKLMRKDSELALLVQQTLNESDLYKSTTIEEEMEEILSDAGNIPRGDEESNAPFSAAKELIAPVGNWLTDLKEVMKDENLKKAVPDAEIWLNTIDKLWIKIGGLKKAMDCITTENKGCCYCVRYKISKTAEKMGKLITEHINNCPSDAEILYERTEELEPPPSGFLNSLRSRTRLLDAILKKLGDDEVDAVGMFGMGGIGKTTLAKEINLRAKILFGWKGLVLDTDATTISYIQSAIAEMICMSLKGIENVGKRASILRHMLNNCKEKGMKILIILDNIQGKLDIEDIGIPLTTCKLLFITRDKDFFRSMGVQNNDIFKVGLIERNEARDLLKSKTENQVDNEAYNDVVEQLLSKCGGLPLTIITRADELRGKDLTSWEKVADYWEMPPSKQEAHKHEHINSIFKRSYMFMADKNQKMFFLLASLFPPSSSVSIESLTRYGIGLDLFSCVDKPCEAMDVAKNWADELVSSSMLLESEVQGEVIVHINLRAFTIFSAAKEEKHNFLVDAIPGLMDDEILNEYTAMSFMSMDKCSRLSGVKAEKLQILKLKGDPTSIINPDFFDGMTDLKVLDLSHMNFQSDLPKSMRKLTKLKTLCMEYCVLGDIIEICGMVNLVVVSLLHSSLEVELPSEIENLVKLRLLDLNGCTSKTGSLISVNVIAKLSDVQIRRSDEGTNSTEYNRLIPLNSPERKVSEIQEVTETPIDGRNGLLPCIENQTNEGNELSIDGRNGMLPCIENQTNEGNELSIDGRNGMLPCIENQTNEGNELSIDGRNGLLPFDAIQTRAIVPEFVEVQSNDPFRESVVVN